MLEIKKGNTSLDLPEDIAMSFEWNSPILDTEVIQGSFSLPVKLPLTPTNQKEMEFAHVLDNRSKFKSSDGWSVFFGGVEFVSGKLKLLQSGNFYEASLLSGPGAVADLLKNKKLEDLAFTNRQINDEYEYLTYEIPGTTTGLLNATATLYRNPTAFTSYTVSFNTNINQTLIDLADAINADPDAYGTATIISGTQIKCTSKLKGGRVFSFELEYDTTTLTNINGSFVNQYIGYPVNRDGIINHLNNTLNLIYPDVDYKFPVFYNPDFYDSANPDFIGFFNYFDTNYKANTSMSTDISICPLPYLYYILDCIGEAIGYKFSGSAYEDSELKTLLLYNTTALDKIISSANIFDHNIIFKNHIPDLPLNEFLNAFRNAFCLAYFFENSNKKIEIIPLKEIITSNEYIDFTDKVLNELVIKEDDYKGFTLKDNYDLSDQLLKNLKPLGNYSIGDPVNAVLSLPVANEVNQLRLVEDINQYYISRETAGNNVTWEFFSDNYYDYKVDDGLQEINTAFSTLLMAKLEENTISTPAKFWLVPSTMQPGSSVFFNLTGGSKAPRFIFYRGLQVDSNGNQYPMASSDVYNYAGAKIADANYCLRWDGEFGRYNVWWKEWLNFLANIKTVPVNANLSAAQLKNFSWKKKIRIGNSLFLPAKIRFTVYKRRISKVQMDLLKIN